MKNDPAGHLVCRCAVSLLLATGTITATAAQPLTCRDIAQGIRALDLSSGKEVPIQAGSQTTFRDAFKECDDRNTFDGKPVPSDHRCRSDKNNVERLLVLSDHTLIATAKAGVDADGSPLSQMPRGSGKHSTNRQTSANIQGKSLDAETLPYVVMPGAEDGPRLTTPTKIGKKDLAIVIYGERCSFAIVGDMGAYNRFGEISMAAHDDLGHPQCLHAEKPCTALQGKDGEGISIPGGVTYVIFPGTNVGGLTAENFRAQVALRGQERIRKLLKDYALKP